MAKDEEKKEEKLEFTPEGETLGYISLDQARVLAMEHARDNPGFYGRRYARTQLVWEVMSQEESEDYYDISLSYRPVRGFQGEPGVEQFTIDKLGPIRLRQILSQPVETGRWFGRPPVLAAGAATAIAVTVGVLFGAGVLPPSSSSGPPGPPGSADLVSAAIAPDAPARLMSPRGDVAIDLDAGSVDQAALLRFQEVSPDQVPKLDQGYMAARKAFDLSLMEDADPTRGASLLHPITITVTLAGTDVALAGGIESNVVIQRFDDRAVAWTPLATTVDFDSLTAQAQVENLSIFALTVKEAEPTRVPTATPTPAPTATSTPQPTATAVPTAAPLPTATPTPPPTFTPTPTPLPAPTPLPTYHLETGLTPGDPGTVRLVPSSDGQTYTLGTTVVVTASCGAVFTGWVGDLPPGVAATDNPLTVTLDRDRVLMASCAENTLDPTPVPTATAQPAATPAPHVLANVMLYLGMKIDPHPFFDIEELREAIYLSIDRNELDRAVEVFLPRENVRKVVSIVEPTVANAAIDRGRDLKSAKQSMSKAGYPDGFSVRLSTTQDLSWAAELVAAQLGEIGIEVRIFVYEDADFQRRLLLRYPRGELDMFLTETKAEPSNPSELLGRLLLGDGRENYTHLTNGAFESIFNAGVYRRAEEVAFDRGPSIVPLLWSSSTFREADAPSHIEPGTVDGRVLWNKQPVQGATVYATDLQDFNSTQYGSDATDANGQFSISGIPEGSQYLYVFGNQPEFWVAAVTPFEMVAGSGALARDTYLCKVFEPISPEFGETIRIGRPLFQWPPYPDAADYAMRVSGEGPGNFFFQRGDTGSRMTETSLQVDADLSPGEYRWRVDAFNADGHIIGCSYFLNSNFTVAN